MTLTDLIKLTTQYKLQEMANDYKMLNEKPKSGPLDCLLTLLDTYADCQLLFKHQNKMLSLIQVRYREQL